MDLLEREGPFEVLSSAVRRAGSDRSGGLFFVGGEAGVGKTALVTDFCRHQPTTVEVLLGACDGLTTPRPLGPLVDIAAEAGGELSSLFAAGAGAEPLLDAFCRQLSASSRTKVAVFEDVHWADDATLDLLRILSRRIGSWPAVLIATFRDDELSLGHPLRLLFGDLATSPNVRRITLDPLSQEAVATLAAESSFDPAELYRLTAGNPFFVTEVLATADAGLPDSVRDAVLARASRLSPEGLAVLRAVAVLGVAADGAILADVLSGDGAAVDECLAHGLLTSRVNRLAFRHELGRLAVLESIPAPQRVALHRRIVGALTAGPVAPDALAVVAHHAEGAGDKGAVVRYATLAAVRASGLHAAREAAAQYRRALRSADDLGPGQRAELLEAYAVECQRLADSLDIAVGARQEAVTIRRGLDDRAKLGASLCQLASALNWAGRDDSLVIHEAIGILETLPPGEDLAWAYSFLTGHYMSTEELEKAEACAERTISLSDQLGLGQLHARALDLRGTARADVGDERGWDDMRVAIDMAKDGGFGPEWTHACCNLYDVGVRHRRFAQVDAAYHDGMALCGVVEGSYGAALLASSHALRRLYEGEWVEAAETAVQVLRHARAATTRVIPLTVLGLVRARRGDPEVWAVLDEALALAIPATEFHYVGLARAARAEAATWRGQMDRALAEASAGWELGRQRRDPWMRGELAYWLWKSGGLDGVPGDLAEPFRLQIIGDWAAAATWWRDLGCPYESARALAEAPTDGPLLEALAVFDRLGARPAASQVALQLRTRGHRGLPRRPRAVTRASRFGLTAREREICELLRAGMTNHEIAARLFLAPKTVGHHVSSILAKTGTSTRRHTARILEDTAQETNK